jgi:hypothetical protein
MKVSENMLHAGSQILQVMDRRMLCIQTAITLLQRYESRICSFKFINIALFTKIESYKITAELGSLLL